MVLIIQEPTIQIIMAPKILIPYSVAKSMPLVTHFSISMCLFFFEIKY